MPHVAAALDSVGVTPREKAEFLEIADGLKWDIIDEPRPVAGLTKVTADIRLAQGSGFETSISVSKRSGASDRRQWRHA